MKTIKCIASIGFIYLSFSSMVWAEKNMTPSEKAFYENVMLTAPPMPADLSQHSIACEQQSDNSGRFRGNYLRSDQVGYHLGGWEKRIAHDWQFFKSSAEQGKITLIDSQLTDKGIGFRYLANDNTQDDLYEPWSSSKVMVFTAALTKAHQAGLSSPQLAGSVPLGDLITSINSYAPFGKADGNSNAIASYFFNVAGRDYATSLLHQNWLNLANDKIALRGAYEVTLYQPEPDLWFGTEHPDGLQLSTFAKNADDPGYRSYRCDECGLTGNKPLTTLAQAEWIKRIAEMDRDPTTAMPGLTQTDAKLLFYGEGHSDKNHAVGGMMQGISIMLHNAIAKAISGSESNAKSVLDDATHGQWRVFQKIGWGPSETRGTGELVVLSHVCLPYYQGGRSFTLAAQTRAPQPEETSVAKAGIKMQALLNDAMMQLLKNK